MTKNPKIVIILRKWTVANELNSNHLNLQKIAHEPMDFLHGPQKNPAKSFGIAEEVNPIYKLAHKELFLICSLMHVLHLINLGEKSAALENF
jgi:hypothetical protein